MKPETFPSEEEVADLESTNQDRLREELQEITDKLREAEKKSDVDEETLLGYETQIRELERQLESSSADTASEFEAPPVQASESSTLDYEGKISALRNRIREAELQGNEKQVLSLEDELRSLEVEQKKTLEGVEYEAVRSVVASQFEGIKKEIQEQTARVEEVENTDEKQYEERLAHLRELEQKRTEAGVFLSRYWGDSIDAHREAEKQFSADVAGANDLQELVKKIESWGGIPQGENGEFIPYSDFRKQMEEVFTAPTNSERARKLQELDINPAIKERIVEGYVVEYNETLLEEKELKEINDVVHSARFQSGLGFKLWSLLPSNKRTLDLLNKYNIDYSSVEARRSAATMGTAFKLREVLLKKKELEIFLSKGEMVEVVEEAPVDVREVSPTVEVEEEEISTTPEAIPVETENTVQESNSGQMALPEEYEGDYEEPALTLEEIARIAQVRPREEGDPIPQSNFGIEIAKLGREEKKLLALQEVVGSDFFPINLRFSWNGRKWKKELKSYQIPYKTKQEKKDASKLVRERLAEVQTKLAKVTEAQNTGKKEIKY